MHPTCSAYQVLWDKSGLCPRFSEPNPPTQPAVSTRTTTSLTIAWQAAAGGDFDHYKIPIDDEAAVQIEKSPNPQKEFTGLIPGTAHRIQLWAEIGLVSSSIQQLNNIYTGERIWSLFIPKVNCIVLGRNDMNSLYVSFHGTYDGVKILAVGINPWFM